MARSAKALALAGLTAAALALPIAAASAHVTVSPNTATKGGYATLNFKVPNERPNASTRILAVEFPEAFPFASISVQPKDGWTYKVEKASLATPISNHGQQVNERVSRITWTAEGKDDEIQPGEFDVFPVSAGPLPTTADALTFKALQTYSNGEVVRWIEEAAPGAEEPRFPAPKLALTGEAGPTSAPTTEPQTEQTSASDDLPTKNQVNLAIGLSVAALILALVGIPAAAMSKRR